MSGTIVLRTEGQKRYVESADDVVAVAAELLLHSNDIFRLSDGYFGKWVLIHDGPEDYYYLPLYWDSIAQALVLKRVF